MLNSELDFANSGYGSMWTFSENCDEHSGSISAGNFLTSWVTIKLSWNILYHKVSYPRDHGDIPANILNMFALLFLFVNAFPFTGM
jgi:hypothetical protein